MIVESPPAQFRLLGIYNKITFVGPGSGLCFYCVVFGRARYISNHLKH